MDQFAHLFTLVLGLGCMITFGSMYITFPDSTLGSISEWLLKGLRRANTLDLQLLVCCYFYIASYCGLLVVMEGLDGAFSLRP